MKRYVTVLIFAAFGMLSGFLILSGIAFGQVSGKIALAQIDQIWRQDSGWQRSVVFDYNIGDLVLCLDFNQRNLRNLLEDKVDIGIRSLSYLNPYVELGAGLSLLNDYSITAQGGFYYEATGYLSRGTARQRGYLFFVDGKVSRVTTEIEVLTSTLPQYSLEFWAKRVPGNSLSEGEKNLYFAVQFLPWLKIGIQAAERHILERNTNGRLEDVEDYTYIGPYIESGFFGEQFGIRGQAKWIAEFDALTGKSQAVGLVFEEEISFNF